MGARSRFVCSGTSAAGVMRAFLSALAQAQLRGPGGMRRTAARSTALARAVFCVSTPITCSTVTASWPGCQQS